MIALTWQQVLSYRQLVPIGLVGDQANFTDAGRLLKGGDASGTPPVICRWGDYEATSFDGAGGIWFAGEYANSHTDPNTAPWFGRNWGTWIGSVNSHVGG